MNTSEDGNIEPLGATTEAVTNQVDDKPADRVEETPDAAQAAEPVQAQGESVVGRRNDDLETTNLAEEPVTEGDDSSS